MKNKFCAKAILPIMLIALFLTACGILPAEGAENTSNSSETVAKLSVPELSEEEQEKRIRTAIEDTLPEGEAIRKFCFADYDHNGRPEAFVLTGKELEEAKGRYEAWFNGEKDDEEAGSEGEEELDSEEDLDDEADIDGEEESDADEELDDEEFDLMMKQMNYDFQLTMWFAYVEDGEVVSEKVQDKVDRASDILALKSASLFQCVSYCTTSFPADLYQVEGNQYKVIFHGNTMDGHAYDSNKSAKALNETAGESDDFVSVASTYDSSYDPELDMGMGHTWKPYYFHYENGVVTEYKGQEISLQEFLQEYSNAEQMLKKYQKKQEFLSAIKRENGMVHVNFVTRESNGWEGYSNVTFRTVDGELTEPYVDDGTYHTTIEEEDYTQIEYMNNED